MPKNKEPHYFNKDMDYRHVETMEEYLRMFEEAEDRHLVIGEGSTNYIYSSCAIRAILDFNPKAKFVLMLRNPVDMVASLHKYLCYKQSETELSIEVAWDLPALKARVPNFFGSGNVKAPGHINYRECAKFGALTQHFIDAIPREQRLVLFFEDFVADTDSVFTDVCRFAGIDESYRPKFTPRNQSRENVSPHLTRFFMYPPFPLNVVKRGVKSILNRTGLTNDGNFYKLLSSKTPRKNLPKDFRHRVLSHYEEDIQLLESLVGRNLESWRKSDSETS